MKDTSIAALVFPSGDRRVFFQENSGSLRQAIYSSKHKTWAADSTESFQLVTNAKNNTPLSATRASSHGTTVSHQSM